MSTASCVGTLSSDHITMAMLWLAVIYNADENNLDEESPPRPDKYSPEVFLKQRSLLASEVMNLTAL